MERHARSEIFARALTRGTNAHTETDSPQSTRQTDSVDDPFMCVAHRAAKSFFFTPDDPLLSGQLIASSFLDHTD